MIYKARRGQASFGEAIGILLLDTFAPYIPGDVANATTYCFPVRFQKVEGFTVERANAKDTLIFDSHISAANKLVAQGVRAVTGDCGFMAIHQKEIARRLDVPVFLSSLLQIPFISRIIADGKKVGIITADSRSLDDSLLETIGIDTTENLKIKGMQDQTHFHESIIEEIGILDSERFEKEVVSVAKQIVDEDPSVKAILLECSLLPPYGAAVQEALDMPVFDYVTMINYVYSAVVKKRFEGFM